MAEGGFDDLETKELDNERINEETSFMTIVLT